MNPQIWQAASVPQLTEPERLANTPVSDQTVSLWYLKKKKIIKTTVLLPSKFEDKKWLVSFQTSHLSSFQDLLIVGTQIIFINIPSEIVINT